jgi:CopG family transcriptional regulator/antitoxin EndoAI
VYSLKRINITVPEATLRLLDQVSSKGDRSKFIAQAVHAYVNSRGRARLRADLKAGAKERAARDLALAEEWFSLDEKAWRRGKK